MNTLILYLSSSLTSFKISLIFIVQYFANLASNFPSLLEMSEKLHFSEYLCPNFAVGNQAEFKTHLLILNSESFSSKLTVSIWNNCNLKVCADGGANRLYDSLTVEERGVYVPQYIIGDLDSLRSDVSEFYK